MNGDATLTEPGDPKVRSVCVAVVRQNTQRAGGGSSAPNEKRTLLGFKLALRKLF
jgi:hypothetical protein